MFAGDLDYIRDTVVIYNKEVLEPIGNMGYKIPKELETPEDAILGFLRLSY